MFYMPMIEIKEDTVTKLKLMKVKHKMKSYDECIKELLYFWEAMP